MYNVGEYIVHPGQGVCRVQSIVEEPQPAYQLMPVRGANPMLIRYPRASEANLRPVLSAAEAEELIRGYEAMELDSWHDRSAVAEEKHFKAVMRRGTCEDVVRVAKTFQARIGEVRANHRKAPVIYERILKEARRRSVEELSVALDESEEQIEARFAVVAGA